MARRVLVTGAAGYIGRHVVAGLRTLGVDVVAIVRPGDGETVSIPDCEVREHDTIADPEPGEGFFAGIDAVIHLAWRDGFVLNSPSHPRDLSAHYRFLTAAAAGGVGTIAGVGTMHEIGYWEGAIGADTPSNPQNLYGVAKAALRDSLELTFKGTETTFQWLRCYYLIGDEERSNSVLNKVLAADQRGDTEFPFTSGKNLYDFTPVETVGLMMAKAVSQTHVAGVIECASGAPLALKDAVEQFIARRGLAIQLAYGSFPDRPFDSPGVWGDASKISAILADATAPNVK